MASPPGEQTQAGTRGVGGQAVTEKGREDAQRAGGAGVQAPARSAQTTRRWVPWFLAAAAYGGFVISLYLTFVHYRGYVSPCYVVEGCEQVQTSRFSVVLGVPVALLGTVFFGLMFYLAIGLLTGATPTLVRAYKVLAFAGALAVVPLFLIQAIALRAFCSYCVATEVIMLSMWIVSFLLTSPRAKDEPIAAGVATPS
jgi:uncharacterized membrane protein